MLVKFPQNKRCFVDKEQSNTLGEKFFGILRDMKCRDGSYHCKLKSFMQTIRMSVFCL